MIEQHVMVDIETLGNDPQRGLILAMAAVKFDPFHGVSQQSTGIPEWNMVLGMEMYCVLSLEDGLRQGFEIEPETLAWWLRPERANEYLRMVRHQDAMPVTQMLRLLSRFCNAEANDIETWCWSNGNTFDGMHLMEKYKRFPEIVSPLHYRRLMDMRTLLKVNHDLFGRDVEWPQRQQHHHPLDDCRVQIGAVQKTIESLRMRSEWRK